MTRCHCAKCHNTFLDIETFDSHRKKDDCVDPEKLKMHLIDNLWRYDEVRHMDGKQRVSHKNTR